MREFKRGQLVQFTAEGLKEVAESRDNWRNHFASFPADQKFTVRGCLRVEDKVIVFFDEISLPSSSCECDVYLRFFSTAVRLA